MWSEWSSVKVKIINSVMDVDLLMLRLIGARIKETARLCAAIAFTELIIKVLMRVFLIM